MSASSAVIFASTVARWTQCRAEFPAEPAHATGRRRAATQPV